MSFIQLEIDFMIIIGFLLLPNEYAFNSNHTIHCQMACMRWARCSFQCKGRLSKYRDFHYKDKAVVRLSYLYLRDENSYRGKAAFIYWDGSPWYIILWRCLDMNLKFNYFSKISLGTVWTRLTWISHILWFPSHLIMVSIYEITHYIYSVFSHCLRPFPRDKRWKIIPGCGYYGDFVQSSHLPLS